MLALYDCRFRNDWPRLLLYLFDGDALQIQKLVLLRGLVGVLLGGVFRLQGLPQMARFAEPQLAARGSHARPLRFVLGVLFGRLVFIVGPSAL